MNIIMMENAFRKEVDPRRRQERRDADLVQEDHKAMANLSEQAIHRQWNPDRFVEKFNMFDQSSEPK